MLCLKRTQAEIVNRGPILRADDYAVLVEAGEVLARAELEAAQIRAQAVAAAEAEKQRGYAEGLERGKAETAELLVATTGQTNASLARLERALVDVVLKATRRIIGELPADERVERVVRQALELMRHQSQVKLRVAPAQRERLQTRIHALLELFPRIQFLDVQADPRLPEDGCVLETELGVVDATIETQLRAIEQGLIKALT